MPVYILCTSCVSEGTGCELACDHNWDNANTEHKQSACVNMRESVDVVSEDINISSVGDKDNGQVPNVELCIEESVKNQGCNVQPAVGLSSDRDDLNICQEFNRSLSLDAKAQKCLSQCKPFPASRDMQEYSLPTYEKADSLDSHGDDSSQGTGYELSCDHNWDNTNTEHKQSACFNRRESVDVSENLNISSVGDKDGVRSRNVELKVEESVKNQGCHIQPAVVGANSDQDDLNMCHEFNRPLSLDAKAQKCLSKCKTFPASRDMQEYSLPTCKEADSLDSHGEDSSASGVSTYSRWKSFPSSSILVSAMKGGRTLNGGMAKAGLHVKWAPEVYDPPSTSMSHTVSGHHHRSKAKKKDKLKNKGKRARRNGAEKKHGDHKSFSKTPELLNVSALYGKAWLSKMRSDVSLRGDNCQVRLGGDDPGGFGKSEMPDVFENGQEVKCGSSFLMEALPKVHFPMGEAS